ncbi:unnamed protein product [Parnassius mnemosyne]|uniref:Reverse transcriptase domain-containing protein n=1 Tax=Parnassius mnemosyne TaxID=213953 RepID=A0AAV1L5D8_9NEOP
MNVSHAVNELFFSHAELFDGGLGRFTGGRARQAVSAGAAPVFCRARPLPYALRERVDAELDAMLRASVIEPVECSHWATPLVIVNISDGAIRICTDYKVTLNRVLSVDKYPVPKIDDLLSQLGGSKFFSKIDLSQAYNQIELDDTKKYNRLVFGLASNPGIFQRIMVNLLKDIEGIVVFLDDVLIASDTIENHIHTLRKVLDKLKEYGLTLKREKCEFFVVEVKYLGYVMNKEGIHPDPDKIESILLMSPPRHFGTSPLYELLKKDSTWKWGRLEQQAFTVVKRRLSDAVALSHYEPGAPLVVTCDASARGLGAVLAQRDASGRERPVMCVSRALTAAECNYTYERSFTPSNIRAGFEKTGIYPLNRSAVYSEAIAPSRVTDNPLPTERIQKILIEEDLENSIPNTKIELTNSDSLNDSISQEPEQEFNTL